MTRFKENALNASNEPEGTKTMQEEQIQKSPRKKYIRRSINLKTGVSRDVSAIIQGEIELKEALKKEKEYGGSAEGEKPVRFFDVITIVNDLPRFLRKKVVESCDWSENIYNQKFRYEVSPSLENSRWLHGVSQAELRCILDIHIEEVAKRLELLKSMKAIHSKEKPQRTPEN